MTAPILVIGGTGAMGNMSSRRGWQMDARSGCSPGAPVTRRGCRVRELDLSSGEGIEARWREPTFG
jgi:hypothetical protein